MKSEDMSFVLYLTKCVNVSCHSLAAFVHCRPHFVHICCCFSSVYRNWHSLLDTATASKAKTKYKMNSKHLTIGSSCPPLPSGSDRGKLRIYSMRFCPFAQRALLVAFAKGVPIDVVNVNLKQKPEWLFEKNPGAKVPTVETREGCLYESVLVAEFLDETYAGRPLQDKDTFRKTFDKIWIQETSKIADPYGKIVFSNGDQQKLKEGVVELGQGLALFEQELKRRGTTYLSGNEAPGMLDYMLWPFIERLPVLALLFRADDVGSVSNFSKLSALGKWAQGMERDLAVKETIISPENHAAYRKSGENGAMPNYDLLAR